MHSPAMCFEAVAGLGVCRKGLLMRENLHTGVSRSPRCKCTECVVYFGVEIWGSSKKTLQQL